MSVAKKIFLVVLVSLCLPSLSWADNSPSERRAAAERYMTTFDLKKMLADTAVQIASQLPAEARKPYVNAMVNSDISPLQNALVDSLVKIFSADELNALADFYGSGPGKSAMEKFPQYMAEMMPAIQQYSVQVAQSLPELQR